MILKKTINLHKQVYPNENHKINREMDKNIYTNQNRQWDKGEKKEELELEIR